jgi:Malate synthase
MVQVRAVAVALIGSTLVLGGCSSNPISSVFGSGEPQANASAAAPGIGVNAFLWRASLDTLSFMPLLTADPWGGVINYDWYIDPQAPNERLKVTIFILDTRLRADALNVTVSKEIRDAAGQWVAAPVAAQTETDLENAILTKARQLNLASPR